MMMRLLIITNLILVSFAWAKEEKSNSKLRSQGSEAEQIYLAMTAKEIPGLKSINVINVKDKSQLGSHKTAGGLTCEKVNREKGAEFSCFGTDLKCAEICENINAPTKYLNPVDKEQEHSKTVGNLICNTKVNQNRKLETCRFHKNSWSTTVEPSDESSGGVSGN